MLRGTNTTVTSMHGIKVLPRVSLNFAKCAKMLAMIFLMSTKLNVVTQT